ncbi:PAS domain S-box-containing protein [Motilibacter rhizosphaerae]|uniref:PAS domain S-box-containing protein n=1 Tax=Motilibacter rhizosphaerae TaxID=598652 RepID=A0A4Q7NQQ4_9ACTN|nr:SpoIIE family protein phosphatase [Motilibacter rhizosphaerae]RZS87563.1 PAS domain S-box-containing protein [Motilibacter rhizosphaerae]
MSEAGTTELPAQALLGVETTSAADRRALPRVLSDAPAAVLMIDTASGTVTYSNPLARELAGGRLPCPVEEWAARAGITVPGTSEGDDPGPGPFALAAAGSSVNGVPVLVPPREGARARVMWVTAWPLPAVAGLRQVSLLVLLPVEPGLLRDDLIEVRNRALVAAGLSFTITDPHQPDNPLVWVNPAFLGTTGYTQEDVLGHNCRFLQGPDTDPAAVAELRHAVRAGEPAQVVLLNYRKDGSAFWNEVSLSPVFDGLGALTHFVGVQADVTARVAAELLREERVREEQGARQRAEVVQERLALLADATESLVATLDAREALARLADLLVPRIADWCMVVLPSERDSSAATEVVVGSADPAHEADRALVERLLPSQAGPASLLSESIAGGAPRLLAEVGEQDLVDVGSPELVDAYRRMGLGSVIVVPLVGRHGPLGALALITSGSGRRYDEDDLQLATDLARRAGLIVDNARLYAREHRVAEALQRSMLPELPDVPGLDVAARYLPGGVGAQVGGDWYDVLALPDGSVGVAIGDVMGHDMAAAAAMGQLRSVLRSYAWQRQRPGQVLDSLDRLVQGLDMAQLATAVFARLVGDEETDTVSLEYANAGHLPPMVLQPDGTVRRLSGAWSVLIGAPGEGARQTATEQLEPGSTLVLVTDGLVEVRGQDLEDGLQRLEDCLRSLVGAPDAQAVLDGLLAGVRPDAADDDIAVLVVRLLPTPGWVRERVELPGDRTAPSAARRAVRSLLAGADDELLQVALLLTSELVSNAVTHGGGGAVLRVERQGTRVRVSVADSSGDSPVVRHQGSDGTGYPSERGRGVLLLDSLARAWGSDPDDEGKTVWFELDERA